MNETHFFFTEGDYQKIAKQTGFKIRDSMKLPKDQYWFAEVRKDLELAFEPEYRWIQLVLTKKKIR